LKLPSWWNSHTKFQNAVSNGLMLKLKWHISTKIQDIWFFYNSKCCVAITFDSARCVFFWHELWRFHICIFVLTTFFLIHSFIMVRKTCARVESMQLARLARRAVCLSTDWQGLCRLVRIYLNMTQRFVPNFTFD
jgi:hypothetical protein